jgi:hypothetical protein
MIGYRWIDMDEVRRHIHRVRESLSVLQGDGVALPCVEKALAATEVDLARVRLRWHGRACVRFMDLYSRLSNAYPAIGDLHSRTAPEEVRRRELAGLDELSELRRCRSSDSEPEWKNSVFAYGVAILIGAWILGMVHMARQLPEGGLRLALALAGVLGPVVVLLPLILLGFDLSMSRRFAADLLRMMGAHTSRARPREWRRHFPQSRKAYLVQYVEPRSELERSGVTVGDVIVAFRGTPIDQARGCRSGPERPTTITVVRQGVVLELSLNPTSGDQQPVDETGLTHPSACTILGPGETRD